MGSGQPIPAKLRARAPFRSTSWWVQIQELEVVVFLRIEVLDRGLLESKPRHQFRSLVKLLGSQMTVAWFLQP